MPKSKTRKKAKPTPQKVAEAATVKSRRNVLGLAVGGVALVGGGVLASGWVQSTNATHDLTRIGHGVPSVVQVHDPTCALCLELQRNTKRALRGYDESELQYLIATIDSDEGGTFAARHGVGHVTLVLLDGAGQVYDIVSGVHTTEELEAIFADFQA